MNDVEKQAAVDSAVKDALVVKAHEKLHRKSFDVVVLKNLTALEQLEQVLTELHKQEQPNTERIAQVEQQLDTLRKDAISATLVPLKTSDILMVRGLVSEVALEARKANYELDVQLFLMIRAEQCGTIYRALRQKSKTEMRYFENETEVTMLDDRVLAELATLYRDAFVLTDEERKNL